jgi:hypothetical protein
MPLRVVLIGASGIFGSRIARRLANDPRFALTLAGRQQSPLAELRDALGDASVQIATLDIGAADLAQALAALSPQLVIHAAGPFQGQDYRVAEACLECRSDYIDLADGRLLVSGASSVPALSSAVVDALLPRFGELQSIEHAINPGNRTPRGDATVASILGYCGRPIRVWRDGRWQQAYGWMSSKRQDFPFGRRRVGVCEIPDLELFPARYPGVHTVLFRAGLELPLLQTGTWCAAVLVRLGLIRHLAAHAPRLRRFSEWFLRFGTDIGGMAVELRGIGSDGMPLGLRWWLDAAEGDGPQVPVTPAVVLAQRLADGLVEARGALPCMGLLTLDQLTAGFDGYALRTGLDVLGS